MKNSAKIWLLPVTVGLLSLFLLAGIFACVFAVFLPKSPTSYASQALRINIPKGTTVIIDDYEEPSFPLGDGYSRMVLQIDPEEIVEFTNSLKASPIWKPLPLPEELAKGIDYLQPSNGFGLEGNIPIPITTATGYYVFIDSQEEYNKRHNTQDYDTSQPFYDRPSFNFTFGLFDDKDGRLYLWSIDT